MRTTIPRLCVAAILGAAASAASPAAMPPGCRLDDASTSMLRIYECREQLRIAAEASTRLAALQKDGRLVGLRVEGGAILVEAKDSFRVVTPQAETEVKASRVAVDAKPAGTAVFVREGNASVSSDGRAVDLGAGQGVDVAARASRSSNARPAPRSERPGLEVKTWGAARANALLGRLGRS